MYEISLAIHTSLRKTKNNSNNFKITPLCMFWLFVFPSNHSFSNVSVPHVPRGRENDDNAVTR